MLDKRTEMMLSVANLLTAEDLDQIRTTAPKQESRVQVSEPPAEEHDVAVSVQNADASQVASPSGIPQGERQDLPDSNASSAGSHKSLSPGQQTWPRWWCYEWMGVLEATSLIISLFISFPRPFFWALLFLG